MRKMITVVVLLAVSMSARSETFIPPVIPDFAGDTPFSTTMTWGGQAVDAHYFPGTSSQIVLILSGVHQDERKAIALASELLRRLQSPKYKPFYKVVLIPDLFGGRKTTDRLIDNTPTNRNSPHQNESLEEAAIRGQGVPTDKQGRKILPENVILFALVEKVRPKDSLAIHSHSIVDDPSQIEMEGAAGVTVDPKPGYVHEADSLAVMMALAARNAGISIPGNRTEDGSMTTRYPTDTVPHHPGTTFGQWGSHRGGMNQYLIETEGKDWPSDPKASELEEIENWTSIVQALFLEDRKKFLGSPVPELDQGDACRSDKK